MDELRNAYGLVIGIANYQNIRKLPYTDDAKDVAAILRDAEICGYTDVKELPEAEATRDAIRTAMENLAGVPPDSTVLIYFSGHGGHVDSGELAGNYLLPVDTIFPDDAKLAASSIPSQTFTGWLNRIAERARQLVVVLDCCHAGGIGETKDLLPVRVKPGLADDYLGSLSGGRGRVIIGAARAAEPAFVIDGARHGTFTQFFLEGLRGGARGVRGVIRIVDLYDFVQGNLKQTRPPQTPVFKGDFEENFPIARHLGGKSGSGETVRGGLEVLIRLAKDPDIRPKILSIRETLEKARAKIRTVVSLKQLHDGLHDVQVNQYDQIVLDRARVPAEAGALQNVRVHANRVATTAKRLRTFAADAYPNEPHGEWLDALERAAADVIQGARAGKAELIDQGIWGINDVLGVVPSMVNTDLLQSVRAMQLHVLFRDLLHLQDELQKAALDPGEVRAFASGGRDLGRLDRDIEGLMDQHDAWQEIDNRLRRIDNNWKGNPRELDFAWPKLSLLVEKQLDAVQPPFLDEIKTARDELQAAMSEPGPEPKLGPYRLFRNGVVQWFFQIDQDLLERCNELVAIDAALTAVLTAIRETVA